MEGTSQPVGLFLSKLGDSNKSGKNWMARCPGHEDTHSSLSIGQGNDGRVLLHCHAGCDLETILHAVGLSKKDLFPPRPQYKGKAAPGRVLSVAALAANKKLPEEFLRGLGVQDTARGVRIKYLLMDGSPAPRQRLRKTLIAKKGSTWEDGAGSPTAYGLFRLKDARESGYLILVEGESDTWTLWFHSFPALGIPGAAMVKTLEASHLEGISRLFVFREPDKGGSNFVEGILRRLTELKWDGTVSSIHLEDAKDPNELHQRDPENFKNVFQKVLDEGMTCALPVEVPEGPGQSDPFASWRSKDGKYAVEDGQTFRAARDEDGNESLTPLANFTARVIREVILDDGADVSRFLVIEGKLHEGRLLPAIRVPAPKFLPMNWPLEGWGFGPSIAPGQGQKDCLRAAIEDFSGTKVDRETIFQHTGWRKVDGVWRYLHRGGATGATGTDHDVRVDLTGPLERYELLEPTDAEDLIRSIRASLEMLHVTTARIVYPVWCAIWRAILGGPDFGLHLAGPTGVGKTQVAALVQQHFGREMDGSHLPGTWTSTANANEALNFLAKDAIFTIDDFAPNGSTYDVQRHHKEADRVFRGQGNRSARNRLNPDATLKSSRPPRGLVQSTGEDIPRGQSVRGRIVIGEMSADDMNWTKLTQSQRDAAEGLYAKATHGFVQWLAGDYDRVCQRLRRERDDLAAVSDRSGVHKRTPRIFADLGLGLKYFLDFALAAKAITEGEQRALWIEGWRALQEAAQAQAKYQDAAEPARRFLELLGSALSSGRAHVASSDGMEPGDPVAWGWRTRTTGTGDFARQEWQAHGERVGWLDGDELYLDPDAAFAVVQEVGGKIGDALTVSAQTLRKRLKEKGLLVSVDQARETLTIRRKLENRDRKVLHLRAASLSGFKEPDIPDIGATQSELPGLAPAPCLPAKQAESDETEPPHPPSKTLADLFPSPNVGNGSPITRVEPPPISSAQTTSAKGTEESAPAPGRRIWA